MKELASLTRDVVVDALSPPLREVPRKLAMVVPTMMYLAICATVGFSEPINTRSWMYKRN